MNQILLRALPVSTALGFTAYLLALVVGITFGTLAALKQNSWLDSLSMVIAMLGISIPNFVLGPLLVLLFSLTLFWFPPALWNGLASKSTSCRRLLCQLFTSRTSRGLHGLECWK